jgi:hypothetical protein
MSTFFASGSGAVALFWMVGIAAADLVALLALYRLVSVIERKLGIG